MSAQGNNYKNDDCDLLTCNMLSGEDCEHFWNHSQSAHRVLPLPRKAQYIHFIAFVFVKCVCVCLLGCKHVYTDRMALREQWNGNQEDHYVMILSYSSLFQTCCDYPQCCKETLYFIANNRFTMLSYSGTVHLLPEKGVQAERVSVYEVCVCGGLLPLLALLVSHLVLVASL